MIKDSEHVKKSFSVKGGKISFEVYPDTKSVDITLENNANEVLILGFHDEDVPFASNLYEQMKRIESLD